MEGIRELIVVQAAGLHRENHGFVHFERNDTRQLFCRFNEEKMVGRLKFQPVVKT